MEGAPAAISQCSLVLPQGPLHSPIKQVVPCESIQNMGRMHMEHITSSDVDLLPLEMPSESLTECQIRIGTSNHTHIHPSDSRGPICPLQQVREHASMSRQCLAAWQQDS